jgi:hypothetical protein
VELACREARERATEKIQHQGFQLDNSGPMPGAYGYLS